MSTPPRREIGIVDAFESIWKRKATEAEAERLLHVQHVLGVRDNDALWSVILALEYYLQLYDDMPGRIEAAAQGVLGDTKKTAARVADMATKLAHQDLVVELGNSVNEVASDAARKQQWRWLAIGIGAAAITLSATSWLSFVQGAKAGLGEGYMAARSEAAAASWANTPEGKLAYAMARSGSLRLVANCAGPGWRASKGTCLPYPELDGTVYGWRLP